MHNSAYYIDVIFVTKMLLQIKFHLFVFQNFSCYNNIFCNRIAIYWNSKLK